MSARTAIAETATRYGLDRAMLVTVAFPDLVLYFADRAIDVPWSASPDGEPLPFYGGLVSAPDIEQRIDRFGVGGASAMSLTLTFSGDDQDIAALMATDRWPQAARVEVALIWPDQDYTSRYVILSNARPARFAAYPDAGTVVMQVARQDEGECGVIGDDTYTIFDARTLLVGWDDELLRGTAMPQVLGRVRHTPAFRLNYTTGNDFLLVAGHPVDSAQSIALEHDGQLIDMATTPYDVAPLVTSTYTRIEGNKGTLSVGGATWDPSLTTDPTHFPGHITTSVMTGRKDRGRVLLGLGRILEYVLRQSDLPVDWARMRRAIRMGEGWDIGIYVSEQVSALELIRSRLLPTSPLSEQRSEAGIWFAWADPGSDPPLAHLVEGQHWHRTGPRESASTVIANSFTLHGRYHYHYERHMDVIRLDRTNSAVCAHSWSTFGARPAETVKVDHIFRKATLWAAARWMARQRALPRSTVEGILDPSLYWLDAGDVVLLTDAAMSITARPAVIAARSAANPAVCVLEIIEQLPSQRSA